MVEIEEGPSKEELLLLRDAHCNKGKILCLKRVQNQAYTSSLTLRTCNIIHHIVTFHHDSGFKSGFLVLNRFKVQAGGCETVRTTKVQLGSLHQGHFSHPFKTLAEHWSYFKLLGVSDKSHENI